jgi:CBS domain containing-hemolysin-like protein
MARLGHLPKPGDEITEGGYTFRVDGVDGRRIGQVRITRSPT